VADSPHALDEKTAKKIAKAMTGERLRSTRRRRCSTGYDEAAKTKRPDARGLGA